MDQLSERQVTVLGLLRDLRGCSFVEIDRALQAAGDDGGDFALHMEGHPNLILWINMSAQAVAAVGGLFGHGFVAMRPTSLLVYLIDGKVPSMPIAKRLPKGGYKEPHWVPVAMDITDAGRAALAEWEARRACPDGPANAASG